MLLYISPKFCTQFLRNPFSRKSFSEIKYFFITFRPNPVYSFSSPTLSSCQCSISPTSQIIPLFPQIHPKSILCFSKNLNLILNILLSIVSSIVFPSKSLSYFSISKTPPLPLLYIFPPPFPHSFLFPLLDCP